MNELLMTLQPITHDEIKLKQNTETVSASLAYFSTREQRGWNNPKTVSVFFQFYLRMCDGLNID